MREEQYLGEILVRRGVVGAERLKPLFDAQREKGPGLLELVVGSNVADGATVAKAPAEECGLAYVARIDVDRVDTQVAAKLPISYAKAQRVLVLGEDEASAYVVCADPLNTAAIDDVRALYKKPVEVAVASAENVVDAIN